MAYLNIEINNIKSIPHMSFDFKLQKGLYAITGENASGKSTLMSCAATTFFDLPMMEYFGKPSQDASIVSTLGEAQKRWNYEKGKWEKIISSNRTVINGFYEGSIIFGNRFKAAIFSNIKKISTINLSALSEASDFVRTNMGKILHNHDQFYKKLYLLNDDSKRSFRINGELYFYENDRKYISQIHMSTGENLLISILHSLHTRIKTRRYTDTPYIVLLDEVELAFHPAALCRLVEVLGEISAEYNMAIYFSTHSIEIIRSISPNNVYYLLRHIDDSVEIITDCYPAFVTKNLYDNYGYDIVFLVEDDLAKTMIYRLLVENELMKNKRVAVIPAGGWSNVIRLAVEVLETKLLQNTTKIVLVLDQDIEEDARGFRKKHGLMRALDIGYLPVKSLEKYLREKLVLSIDTSFYRRLDDSLFHKKPVDSIVKDYSFNCDVENDNDGKTLYNMINAELRQLKKDINDLVDLVIKHIYENNPEDLEMVVNFLKANVVF